MFAVDPVWYTAHDAPGKQLTVLVELIRLGRWLSNVPVPDLSPTPDVLLRSLQSGSLSAMQQQLDPWTGVSQIGNLTMQLDNSHGFAQALPGSLLKSPVSILLSVGSFTSLAACLPLFYGHVESISSTPDLCTFQLVPGAFAWHHDLSIPVGDVFPQAPASSRSQAVPLVVGLNTAMEVIPLTAPVLGSLAFALTTSDSMLFLTEFQANFPATGTMVLEEETGVTYSAREVVVLNSVNYLRLSGLVRPAPVAHAVGSAVTLVQMPWQWLIGTQSTVFAVRSAGLLLPGSAYTVSEQVFRGLTMTLLTITEDLPSLTVDVTGGNLTPPLAPLVNGDFDAGTLTGWTVTDMTASVTGGDTADQSPYKAVLLAPLAPALGQLSQVVDVEPGREISLILAWQSRPSRLGNLVSNGDFASHDLTGWEGALPAWNTQSPTGWSYASLTGSSSSMPFAMASLFDEPGMTLVAVDPPPLDPSIDYYAYSRMYNQELTVTVGTMYQLTVTVAMTAVQTGPQTYHRPSAYCSVLPQGAPVVVAFSLQPTQFGAQVLTREGTFQASTPQVLLSVQLTGFSRQMLPLPIRWVEVVVLPLTEAAVPSTTLRLGTTATPSLYAEQAMQANLPGWQTVVLPCVPTEDTLQILVQTQYSNALASTPPATWVDAVRLETTGRNPVEVIRWMIETFLPGLSIHEASFAASYQARAAWFCSGQWRDPGHSRALLLHLADQFELLYFENAAGQAVLVARQDPPAFEHVVSPAVTAQTSSAWRFTHPPSTQLGTDFFLYYNPIRGSSGTDPANYGSLVSATPEHTSGPLALAVLCASAAQTYGLRQTQRYFAEGIQDQETAHRKLTALVARQTTLASLLSCTVQTLQAAPWELGDLVALLPPHQGPLPVGGELFQVAIDLSTPAVHITARLTGTYGTEEGYEMPEEIVLDGTEEGYEV